MKKTKLRHILIICASLFCLFMTITVLQSPNTATEPSGLRFQPSAKVVGQAVGMIEDSLRQR